METPLPPPQPAGLDAGNPITPLQSATVLNALRAMVPQLVVIVATITGKTLDVDAINQVLESGISLLANGITIFYLYRTIRSRINATQIIQK